MIRPPPVSPRTDASFPVPTLSRSTVRYGPIAPALIPHLQRTAVAAHGYDLRRRVVRHRRGMVVQAPVEVDEGLGELRIDARLRPYRPPPRQRGQRAQR